MNVEARTCPALSRCEITSPLRPGQTAAAASAWRCARLIETKASAPPRLSHTAPTMRVRTAHGTIAARRTETASPASVRRQNVDRVVTEYGVAELRGSSIAERTRRLIDIAHPKFRDDLGSRARELGYLR